METSTTYYWRIDEVGLGGTTSGAIWSFTTAAASDQVSSPSPVAADGEIKNQISTPTTTFEGVECKDTEERLKSGFGACAGMTGKHGQDGRATGGSMARMAMPRMAMPRMAVPRGRGLDFLLA